jgi:spore coat protein U-like protein
MCIGEAPGNHAVKSLWGAGDQLTTECFSVKLGEGAGLKFSQARAFSFTQPRATSQDQDTT